MDRMWFGGSTKLSDVLDMGEGKGESRMISRVMTWAVVNGGAICWDPED